MYEFDVIVIIISVLFPILFISVFVIIVASIIRAVKLSSIQQQEIRNQFVDTLQTEPETILYPSKCPGCGAPNPDNSDKCKYCDRTF